MTPRPMLAEPEWSVLLNNLNIVGPNIRHALVEDELPPIDPKQDPILASFPEQEWCVCGREWPCEAQRLGDVVAGLATLDAAQTPKVAPDLAALTEALHAEMCGPNSHPAEYDRPVAVLVAARLIAAGYGRDEELRAALLTIAGPTLVEAGHGCVTVDRMRAVARAALASPDPATPDSEPGA